MRAMPSAAATAADQNHLTASVGLRQIAANFSAFDFLVQAIEATSGIT